MKAKNMAIAMGMGAVSALGLAFIMTNKKVAKKAKKTFNNTVNQIEKKYDDYM